MADANERLDRGKTMNEMWLGFAAKVIPGDTADAKAYRELQAAFYAGALCLFNWFMVQLDEDAEPTDGDLDKVAAMDKEINTFFERFL